MSEISLHQKRSILTHIFLSPEEPRLRAGWRLSIQTILLVVLLIITAIVSSLLGISKELMNSSIGGAIVLFIAFTGSVYIARRWLDKRSFTSLGLKLDQQTALDLLAGIGITLVQFIFIYLLMFGVGWLTFEGFAWEVDPIGVLVTNVLIFLVVYIFVGWQEELLSRGYHLQTIASGTNLFWGVVISSAVFGLLHLGNPNVSRINTAGIIAGIFFAGVYLAYAYIRTNQLWLAIGLHIGWNFFQGVVFGFPVSGMESYRLTRISIHGPELWTGGAFGPESGLIVLPSLIVGGFLIYFYTRKRAK